jgi:hypothetical protein
MKMGDRTGVTVTIKSSDISKFMARASQTENFQDVFEEEVCDSDDGKTVSIMVEDVNWFGIDDISILSNAGLSFLYEHGPGDEYDAGCYACYNGKCYGVTLSNSGHYLIHIEETGQPNREDLKNARMFLKTKALVEDYFSNDPEGEHSD